MSSTIWTQCAGKSKFKDLAVSATRVVEDQYKIATRRLVDSQEEQEHLEVLLDWVKPLKRSGDEWDRLHYLLSTPFRYPPLPHGSRFGTASERGLWFGSLSIDTALAEVAFWRLRFLNQTEAQIVSDVSFTAYSIPLRSSRAINLAAKPFDLYKKRISSPTSYADSQPLGTAMREDRVEFCQYVSARDPGEGLNVAVFSPNAFARKTISNSTEELWHGRATRTDVEFRRRTLTADRSLRFLRKDFEIGGQFPLMKN